MLRIICIVMVLEAVLFMGCSSNTKEATQSTAVATEAIPTVVEAMPTAVPVEPTATSLPEWQEGAPLSQDSALLALSNADKMSRSLDLSKPASILIDSGIVTVTYRATEAWSETDLLTIGAQTSFSVHRSLFANPLVQTVTVIIVGDWTDQYGKATEENTTVSTLDRATVDSRIDWKGLEDRVQADNKVLFCVSDVHYIHPAILARLGDKGCLAP